MSDMDTLIVTFQTQLSDVMEAVVKTAMYEVTRLVEDSFLEELKSRNQEVQTLRLQLQWAERKLTEQGGKDGGTEGKCADLTKDDGERPEEPHDDVIRGAGMKKENEAVESWTKSCRREVKSGLIQEVDTPAPTFSPEIEPQGKEDDNLMQVVDVKEEAISTASCSSVCLEGWSITQDGDAGSESHNASEVTEAEAKHTQDTSEELLRNVIKQDLQNYVFPEDQPDTNMSSHSAHISSVEMNNSWAGMNRTSAGLQHNHRLGTEKDHETIQTRGPLNCIEQELPDSATTDPQTQVTSGRDQISSSGSPKAKLVLIKQEVIAECDGVEDGEQVEKKEMTKSGLASFSCSVKQHKVRAEVPKQNRISHKTTVQEVVKLHSKMGTGLRLQAAIQHLHRPVKKPPNPLSNSTTSALSVAQSQAVNLNPLHRLPSTSKAAPPPPLSIQRIHLGDKQALNRTGAPWVSIKSQHQSANSHTNPVPLPDSHPHPGPRHVLRCGQCGKCFPHPSNLKAHLQTHTGERPFCCSLCGRSFTKLSNLKAHRRVHTGERPYCCMACGKRFTQKCNLKRHQRIHVDV